MLGSSRMNQILQTVMDRLDDGMTGPPDSYSEEEKEYYRDVERDILASRKAGFRGVYVVPDD